MGNSTDSRVLIVIAIAVALLSGVTGPASAQFFNFGGPPQRPQRGGAGDGFGGGWFGNDIFAPFQQQVPRGAPLRQRQDFSRTPVREDFSRAPPPEKRGTSAERNVVVLGDGMADWLAYGLERAYSETPDMGVTRKHKTVSGLIRYQPKGDPVDWPAAAKGILATEKPDVVVVMLGFNDRMLMREPVTRVEIKPTDRKKDARSKPEGNDVKAGATAGAPAKADYSSDNAVSANDDQDDTDALPINAPGKTARSPNGVYEFREQRWVELYTKKIEEMIGVVKAKSVPVIWVGLPAVRGVQDTADMLFLDSLYRDAAAKAGITYVDVWDGFVDEGGRFVQQGPDFEGQTRRLRSSDGVFFTAAGARKLAHYVEREVTRVLAARSAPITLPIEPVAPGANALPPGQSVPRPLAGPILPLVASSVATDQLLGGPGSNPAVIDALAARTLVKGEPLAAPAGRADDFSWPRREVGQERATEELPVASASPDDRKSSSSVAVVSPPKPRKTRPIRPASRPSQDFVGLETAPQPASPRAPRPVARSAAVPGLFTR